MTGRVRHLKEKLQKVHLADIRYSELEDAQEIRKKHIIDNYNSIQYIADCLDYERVVEGENIRNILKESEWTDNFFRTQALLKTSKNHYRKLYIKGLRDRGYSVAELDLKMVEKKDAKRVAEEKKKERALASTIDEAVFTSVVENIVPGDKEMKELEKKKLSSFLTASEQLLHLKGVLHKKLRPEVKELTPEQYKFLLDDNGEMMWHIIRRKKIDNLVSEELAHYDLASWIKNGVPPAVVHIAYKRGLAMLDL